MKIFAAIAVTIAGFSHFETIEWQCYFLSVAYAGLIMPPLSVGKSIL